MVAATAGTIFDEGIYTLDQAARLARLSPQLFRNWFDGSRERKPTAFRRMPKNSAGVLAFVDVVQAMAIRAIRRQRKLSLQKIRETIVAAHELGIEYPFARKHQTYLFADDVVIRLTEPEDRLIQVTGKYKQQNLLKPVVELYLDDLVFDEETGLAFEYTPMSEGKRKIVINPAIKYGAPVVMPAGHTVGSLISAFDGEGSIADAAAACGVEEGDIKLALKYDDLLSGISA